MNILGKIATPFVALWRWIKETAWVQPLLIVGVIFGLIFSIPSIVAGVQNLIAIADNGLDYYEKIQLSLWDAYKGESEVDEFFEKYDAAQGYKDGDPAYTLSDYNAFKDTYGEKFFLIFTQSDCEYCEYLSDALEQLKNNWNSSLYNDIIPAGETYRAYSIICNQDMGTQSDNYFSKKAFQYIMDDHSGLFLDMQTFATRNTYYTNLDSSSQSTLRNNCEKFLGESVTDIQTPCVVLFDLTGNATNNGDNWNYICTTLFYSFPSSYDSNEITRARFLATAWAGTDDFAIKK